jgi:outer membrane protein
MRRLTRVPVVLLLLAAWAAPARAQDRPTLELTLDDAVKRAMESNADIRVDSFNPQTATQNVRSASGYYDPFVTGVVDRKSVDTPQSSVFSGAQTVTTATWDWNVGLQQAVKTGAVFNLTFFNNYVNTNSVFTTFNPTYNSQLALSVNQPLLKNFMIDAPRAQLLVSKKNSEISDLSFRQTVLNVLAVVKGQYYDLIYAIDNLAAARQSLDLAQKLLNENQIKVKVGTMAPLDVVEAQSEVATRESNVITAENGVAEAEDTLKRSIFPQNDPNTWALRIVPKDRPTAEPFPVNMDAAIKRALENRTDVQAQRKVIEAADIQLRYAKNQKLPQFDLIGSYGGSGIGGDQLIRDTLGGAVVQTIPGGYGDALGQVFGVDFPGWVIRVNASYSIRNRTADAQAALARIGRDQNQAILQRLELNAASEVRTAARAVETNFKLVDATRAARILQEKRLDAEEKKFAAGMSTNFLVTQAQRDLATAQVAEVQAIANYRKSLVSYERVQETGANSTGSATLSVVTAGGTRLSVVQ